MGSVDVLQVITVATTFVYRYAQVKIRSGVGKYATVLQASLAIILINPVCKFNAE